MKYNKTIVYYIYSQLPSASLQLAVCCRRIPSNKDSLYPVGCRSTDNKNTPLHVKHAGRILIVRHLLRRCCLYYTVFGSLSLIPGKLLFCLKLFFRICLKSADTLLHLHLLFWLINFLLSMFCHKYYTISYAFIQPFYHFMMLTAKNDYVRKLPNS